MDKTIDIYHVHGEPMIYVSEIKALSKKPVIMDIHDSEITRTGIELTDERDNMRIADGLVFVSDDVKDVVMKHYNIKSPAMVLYSYCPEIFYPYQKNKASGGLVYQGLLAKDGDQRFLYCNYEMFAREAREMGVDFHIYSNDNSRTNGYKDLCTVHKSVDIYTLLKELGRFDWGLCGNNFPTDQWDKTIPNKLFDYLASGIPVIAMNASATAKIIKEYEVGIEVDGMWDLKNRWEETNLYRKNALLKRREFLMENHIGILIEFYKQFI
jgi:glycosyltransferase involved in cell wall biosynthesis